MCLFLQFKGRPFKVALLDQWLVILSGEALVDELRRLPADVVSFGKGLQVVRASPNLTMNQPTYK